MLQDFLLGHIFRDCHITVFVHHISKSIVRKHLCCRIKPSRLVNRFAITPCTILIQTVHQCCLTAGIFLGIIQISHKCRSIRKRRYRRLCIFINKRFLCRIQQILTLFNRLNLFLSHRCTSLICHFADTFCRLA